MSKPKVFLILVSKMKCQRNFSTPVQGIFHQQPTDHKSGKWGSKGLSLRSGAACSTLLKTPGRVYLVPVCHACHPEQSWLSTRLFSHVNHVNPKNNNLSHNTTSPIFIMIKSHLRQSCKRMIINDVIFTVTKLFYTSQFRGISYEL